jgi:hypothetical protein
MGSEQGVVIGCLDLGGRCAWGEFEEVHEAVLD